MPMAVRSQRVAVTGATGFIGLHLLRGLHAAGAHIIAIVAASKHPERLETLPFPFERIVVDSLDHVGAAIAQANARYVVHLGAFISTERSLNAIRDTVAQNLLPTIDLLTAASESTVERVVLMGSCEEYSHHITPFDTTLSTNPSSPYGASKAAATAYAAMFTNAFNLPTVVLRPSVVYGPGQSPRMLISQVMHALAEDRVIDVTAGKQTRDFVFVEDVVDAIILALTAPNIQGNVWNVGSGEVVIVRECLERIERLTGRQGLIEYGKRAYIDREIFHYELKVKETYAAFNWRPSVMLDEGLRRTWESILQAHQPHQPPAPRRGHRERGLMPLPLISLVVPVFNEEPNIFPFYERAVSATAPLSSRFHFEFVFTDNHSTDRTFALLSELAARDARVRVFRFSKNFGFQRSILTGYTRCRGDAAVQLDVDLQDPPELIATFLEHWQAGADVVYGVRTERPEGRTITALRSLFYRLVDKLSEEDLPVDAGDFRLISRRVIDLLTRYRDENPYLRGTIATLGFRQVGVPYTRDARQRGESKFPFSKLLSLAVDGILNHSTVPLRFATWFGLAASLGTIVLMVFYTAGRLLLHAQWPAGFTTLAALILMSISINAMLLGIIGEYLGRMYRQVRESPLSIIEAAIDPPPQNPPA